ncbi:MAG TPA: GyrI-like domain-containing protein [Gaiellaceae bacterium]
MSTLALDFTITHVPEQTFAYVVRRVAPDQIGEFVAGALERVGRAVGPAILGPPMSVSSAPDEQGGLVLEVGFTVAPGTTAEPPVEVRTLPASVAIIHRHVGPYEDLGGSFYSELFSQAHDQGFTPVSAPRERYLGEEDGVPVTEIVWPIA